MTRTPGPWKTGTGEFTDQIFCDDPTGEQGSDWGENFICETCGNEANAAFIVRACNAHEELVAALKRCQRWFEDNEGLLQSQWGDDEQDTIEGLQTAIAKAEGSR